MQIVELNQKLLKKFSLNKQAIIGKAKTTGLYLLVPIINFGVSAFTSPIFAKYLTAEEFGYFGYFNSLALFFTTFYSLSFPTYHMSIFFKEKEQDRKSIVATLVMFNLLWNLVFFPVSCFGVFLYMKYSHSDIPFYPFALLAFAAAVLSKYKDFVQVNYRLGQKPFLYFIFVSGYRVLTIVVSLYFVMNKHMGLYGRLLGILVTEVLFFVVSLIHILKDQPLVIRKDVIRKAFKMVLPLFPASFLYLPLLSYDNIVLERMHQPAEMGLYNIGKNIATYLYTALFPFYQTFEPDIYKNTVQRNIKSLKRTSLLIIAIVAISLVAFWLFSPLLINFLTAGKYNSAMKYSNIIAVTSCLMIVFSIFDAMINALHETKKSLLINAISACLCIALYTFAATYFAQIGVAIATVITYVCLISLQAFFVIRKFKADVNNQTILPHASN